MSFRFSIVSAGLRVSATAEPDARHAALETEVIELFEQFRAPLLHYVATFGLNPSEGEDAVQEVFLALFLHLQRNKSRENLRGWLFRVAHNRALKKRREVRLETVDPDFVTDPGPNPEDQCLDNKSQQRLRAVVDALPPQDRRCLFLRAEGLNYRNIAGLLDISIGAVSLSLTRSLARLARSIGR